MKEQTLAEPGKKMKAAPVQKVTPFLWFNYQAEKAANYYVSVFKNSKINTVTHYTEAGAKAAGEQKGSVMTVDFQIEGQEFVALNGGPVFQLTPAVSFVVNCDSQEEIDYFWEKLSDGGDESQQQCGWLQDKFGVSWQIVPSVLNEMLREADNAKSERIMQAVLKMKKLDLRTIRKAYDGS